MDALVELVFLHMNLVLGLLPAAALCVVFVIVVAWKFPRRAKLAAVCVPVAAAVGAGLVHHRVRADIRLACPVALEQVADGGVEWLSRDMERWLGRYCGEEALAAAASAPESRLRLRGPHDAYWR